MAKQRPSDRDRAARRARASALARSVAKSEGASGAEVPSQVEIAEAALVEFGGIRNVCRMLYAEFNEAKPGTQTRQRILETVQRMVSAGAKSQGATSELPEELGDEDLERTLVDELERLADEAEEEGADDLTAADAGDESAERDGEEEGQNEDPAAG